jgi:hypothetical protein
LINMNGINYVLKGTNAIDNIMNIFFHCFLQRIPIDMWIMLMNLMNALFIMDLK